MGNDGVDGMENVKKAHGKTYAQDEESSEIYGMSKLAIEANSINSIISATDLAEIINNLN